MLDFEYRGPLRQVLSELKRQFLTSVRESDLDTPVHLTIHSQRDGKPVIGAKNLRDQLLDLLDET